MFRTFLQTNASQIMKNERNHLTKTKSCWIKRADVHVHPTRAIPAHYIQERNKFKEVFKVEKPYSSCSAPKE